jgi:hypothetical protein
LAVGRVKGWHRAVWEVTRVYCRGDGLPQQSGVMKSWSARRVRIHVCQVVLIFGLWAVDGTRSKPRESAIAEPELGRASASQPIGRLMGHGTAHERIDAVEDSPGWTPDRSTDRWCARREDRWACRLSFSRVTVARDVSWSGATQARYFQHSGSTTCSEEKPDTSVANTNGVAGARRRGRRGLGRKWTDAL